MRKVFGIGESVFDIVFKDGKPLTGVPGGSTFNSIISLGRCGAAASILTEVGNDKVGEMVCGFLAQNGVREDYVNRLPCRTPVSIAFLNADNEAQYTFYRDNVEVRPDFRLPMVSRDDIVIFGSFYAVNPASRSQVLAFLRHCREAGAVLYYDVNFRPSHRKDLGDCSGNIDENYALADVVRGSKDDFLTLYGFTEARDAFRKAGCANFIFTDGPRPVRTMDVRGFDKEYSVAPIETVSTIGAGDSFNAGFVFGLLKLGITKKMLSDGLSESQWDFLAATAQSFSADCCNSLENYVSEEFAKRLSDPLI